MYISVEQSLKLDAIVKSNEVALRSFVANILVQAYSDHASFKTALQSISISDELIYSRRFAAKLRDFISRSESIYALVVKCDSALSSKCYDNDVPYVSELIDLLLIFFNAHFNDKNIVKEFSSIEEFHYCCTLYHKSRNNLAHPASRPITILDANKVVYFIENVVASLEGKYFWFYTKDKMLEDKRLAKS